MRGEVLDVKMFNGVDLPVGDRFDVFQQLLRQAHAPMYLTSDFAADFEGTMRQSYLGDVELWQADFPQLTFRRTSRLIRQSDPERCNLAFIVQGGGLVRRDGRETVLNRFDIHTNHTSAPFDIVTARGHVGIIGVEVPRTSLGLPWERFQQVVGQGMSSRDGIGALLAQFLTQVAGDTHRCAPSEAPRLGQVLTGLVTALFARALDAEELLPPETRTHSLMLEVKDFLRRNLGDADLSPSSIAAAHRISRSHLHRLFQGEGVTVAAYIRAQRLEAARRDLADPSAATVPVHVIRARHGFKDPTTFTRSFRAAFGITPRDYRHETGS